MKIGEYEQMMSYLTRPEPTTPIEPRENLKYGSVPGEGNSKISYDPEIDTYRKKVQETIDGKKTNKYIFSQPGDSLEDFKKIKPVRSTGADDATVKARQYIDNWTKNWFDNNLKNYGVKDFDAMIDGLSSDWQLQLESGDVSKASKKFNFSTSKLGLPNITSGRDARMKKGAIEPFNYNNVKFYANLEGSKEELGKTLSQYKKVFYKNKIESNPKLREGLNKFFDFMSADKRGLYLKLDGKTIKDFMNTEVSDEVKFLLDTEISGLDKTTKNEVFNSYPDLADNYNKFTEDKVRLKAVQRETEAVAKAGEKTAEQYKKVKADIAKQNDVLAKMSVKDIASNKELLNSVRMSINSKTGDVSYTNYTANDPKGKPALTDLELAEKIKQKAKDKNFYVTEHIGKKSLNKTNLAFPNNVQSANYMSNSQLENARRFLINPENRNTPAAQNLDKTLEDLKLTIRGPEYGGKPIGNKIPIVFDSKTGLSNIVEDQSLNNKKSKGVMLGSAGDLDTAARIIKEDFQTAKKLFGEYAPQIARSSLPAIKLLLAETGIGAAFVPMDIAEGLTPKEVLLNLGTMGIGVPYKDIQERAKFVEEKGLGTYLTDAFNKQMIPQNIRPALNMPADFGASQDLTEKEQQAMQMFETEAREPIESRREKRSKEMIEQYSDPEFGFRGGAMNGGIMRLGFKDGSKDPKMNRRTFMKTMAGLASIPVLGRFMKPAAKVAESAAPVVADAPAHFLNLVAKIKKLGSDVTSVLAYKDTQKITKFKDYELTEDLATGEQTIQRYKTLDDDSASYYGNPLTEETYMSYKPGLADETTKGKTPPGEYEEGTALLRNDKQYAGEIVDEMSGISDDIFEETGLPVPEAIRKK